MSAQPAERHVLGLSQAGFHRNAYWEWPSAGTDAPTLMAPTLMAVHGLTRNGRDFDGVAQALAAEYRIVCPDVVGRGRSERLADGALYSYAQYLADATALIARLGVETVDWLGTSMGGLIGMMLAAQPGTPIRRLILNDIGPFVPKAALERLGGYVGQDPRFQTIAELEAYLRRFYAPFGPLSDAEWAHLARWSARPEPDGGFRLAYDPAIARAVQPPFADVDLWVLWERITCPVLVIRGALSDLLLSETAVEMVRRKPDTEVVEFPECGHAPALFDPAQIGAIRDWLSRT